MGIDLRAALGRGDAEEAVALARLDDLVLEDGSDDDTGRRERGGGSHDEGESSLHLGGLGDYGEGGVKRRGRSITGFIRPAGFFGTDDE